MASTVPEIVKQRVAAMTSLSASDQVDLLNLLNGLVDAIKAVTTLLDADATVTGTTYSASFDALLTK